MYKIQIYDGNKYIYVKYLLSSNTSVNIVIRCMYIIRSKKILYHHSLQMHCCSKGNPRSSSPSVGYSLL